MGNTSSSHGSNKNSRKCRSLPNSPDVRRQIPLPYTKTNGSTSIPLPATVQVQRRCPPDKVRPLPPTPNHVPSIPGLGKTGNSTCVENTTNYHHQQQNSNINSNHQHQNSSHSPQKGNNNGLRQPQSKIPTSPVHQNSNQQNGSIPQLSQQLSPAKNVNAITTTVHTKHSMLDKLKLFHKDKSSSASAKSSHVSKRTSSSSGFSSARSERSDSSVSLNDGHGSHIKLSHNNTNTINRTKCDNAKNSKQSKIFATKEPTISTNKKENIKEKSPARSKNESQQQIGGESKSGQRVNTKISASHTEQQQKTKTSSKILVNNKSVTKTNNLVIPVTQTKTLVSTVATTTTGNITSIPKPMAAIKGTSKTIVYTVDKPQQTDMGQMMKKLDKNEILSNNHDDISDGNAQHIIVDNMKNVCNEKNNVINKQDMTRISIGNSIHSNTSAFYRPVTISNQQIALQNPQMDIKDLILKVQYDRQNQTVDMIHQNGHTNGKKYNTVPNNIIGTIYEEEPKSSVNVIPMRPLLRGYNSHLTLPTRGSNKSYLNDFSESDIGQGYCSDGDSFRHMTTNNSVSRFVEIDNGYLSEGSGSTNNRARHGKNFLSVMRKRIQLPTTIEERIRGSQGSLDSICTVPASNDSPTSPNKKMITINKNDENISNKPSTENENIEMVKNGLLAGVKYCDNQHKNEKNSSPTSGNKEITSENHENVSKASENTLSSERPKGVPTTFNYVKRNSNSLPGTIKSVDQQGRTAHVSATPRSDQMSDGIQTNQKDVTGKIFPNSQYRSFSLTGPGATQLSQSIRERLSTGSHSLPKHGIDIHSFQHRIFNRSGGKMFDGSLSDTQTYAEVKTEYSPYSMWLKDTRSAVSRICDGDVQPIKLIQRSGESTTMIQSPRMNRSSSIRSTKSDKSYPSILTNGSDIENEPFYCLPVGTIQNGKINFGSGTVVAVPWSQPTSPTPLHNRGPMSPTLNISNSHRLTYTKKNDEVHGSAASLLSGGSSLYGSVEERQANEVRRLKRELTDARDQCISLSSQLSTNAHVVAAFEQSLANMTTRLQQLTATAERKDSELTDMRQTIELLRKQSIQAGLTSAHMQSMGVHQSIDNQKLNSNSPNKISPAKKLVPNVTTNIQQQHSSDSMNSLNSISSGCSGQDKKKKKGWLRSSFTKAFSRNAKIAKTNRNVTNNQNTDVNNGESTTRNQCLDLTNIPKNPILSPPSPTKFSPYKSVTIVDNAKPVDAIELNGNPAVETLKKQLREKDLVLTDIRLEALSSASQLESLKETVLKMRAEMLNLKQNNERLQKLVTSRSLAGSDLSLGNSTSPTGSIGENRRYSLADGNNRPPMELPRRCMQGEEAEEEILTPAPEQSPSSLSPTTHIDLTPPPPAIEQPPSPSHMALNVGVDDIVDPTEGKKISIAVYLGQPESFTKYLEEICEYDISLTKLNENQKTKDINKINSDDNSKDNKMIFKNLTLNEFVIAQTYISGKTSWQNLDYIVRKTFKDYVARIDPGTNLGLNTDSITSYHLGEAIRGPEIGFPELLPCGYIIGNVRTLYICLQGVGSLAFDSLIPRSIVHRYISLLTEHRRLILCGPSGTGKSYLARKLAEFLVARSGRGNPSEAIATFNVDHKSSKELRQFLGLIADQASISNGSSELPAVIILDNLHHASALGDVFSTLLSGPAGKLPCIIGTMSQATCNTTNLQLHHNFRWVLTANHMEPVKGFLGRFLRRRVFTLELQTQNHKPELTTVLAWLTNVWQHINKFLENHSSSDVTIGPRLFLSCPLDLKDSQVWFTDVWNYHLAPYLIDAVREGVQLYGRRGGSWCDPSEYIRDTYPWPYGPDSVPPLRQINAEDVGLEGESTGSNDSHDPLLNMLIHLQEAANYPGTQENESDCISLDSNITAES